jgi:hypothetical protein
MDTPSASNSGQNEPSPQAGRPESAANEPTIEEIRSWEEAELLVWIQKKLPKLFKGEDAEKFLKARINGDTFLDNAGNTDLFMKCNLPVGVSYQLAKLTGEIISKKSKCCRSTSYTLRRQSANNVTGDSEQAGLAESSDTASKKKRLDSDPLAQQALTRYAPGMFAWVADNFGLGVGYGQPMAYDKNPIGMNRFPFPPATKIDDSLLEVSSKLASEENSFRI